MKPDDHSTPEQSPPYIPKFNGSQGVFLIYVIDENHFSAKKFFRFSQNGRDTEVQHGCDWHARLKPKLSRAQPSATSVHRHNSQTQIWSKFASL
jgi:hypothetical protein